MIHPLAIELMDEAQAAHTMPNTIAHLRKCRPCRRGWVNMLGSLLNDGLITEQMYGTKMGEVRRALSGEEGLAAAPSEGTTGALSVGKEGP